MAQLVIPNVRVGDAVDAGPVSIVPLFRDQGDAPVRTVPYIPAHEAIAAGLVEVEEVSEAGSVPQLKVVNRATDRVLFLEGEELRGAKQNRVLNTSVLVAAASTTLLPVSCVEQGRWRYRGRMFQSSGHFSSPRLRAELKRSSGESLARGGGHASDQSAVWREVQHSLSAHDAASETTAYSDAFETRSEAIAQLRASLRYVEGALGVAVVIGPRVVALDLFDKESTCSAVWDRLLTGVCLQALETVPREPAAAGARPDDVRQLIARLADAPWNEVPAAAEGKELRSTLPPDTHASALVCDDVVIHASALLAK